VDPEVFVRRNTAIAVPPLVPEIRLYLATEVTPIWLATEETLARSALPPPYWAFAWAGGQALARYLLDRPAVVAGRSVLDFGAGSGLVGIAAAKAGAASVLAAEIDNFAAAAIAANAVLNDVEIAVQTSSYSEIRDAHIFPVRASSSVRATWCRQAASSKTAKRARRSSGRCCQRERL
jgi:predicted nicotinamide N-methyase